VLVLSGWNIDYEFAALKPEKRIWLRIKTALAFLSIVPIQ